MDAFEKYPDLMRAEFIKTYQYDKCWTVENPNSAMSELDVCVALIATEGNFTMASRYLGRSRRALEGFVTRDRMLSDLVEDLEQTFLDDVEAKYRTIAQGGDGQAARFFLSTKGKSRGFTQRSEMTGANGGPIEHEVSPRELLLNKLAGLRAARGTDRSAGGSE